MSPSISSAGEPNVHGSTYESPHLLAGQRKPTQRAFKIIIIIILIIVIIIIKDEAYELENLIDFVTSLSRERSEDEQRSNRPKSYFENIAFFSH